MSKFVYPFTGRLNFLSALISHLILIFGLIISLQGFASEDSTADLGKQNKSCSGSEIGCKIKIKTRFGQLVGTTISDGHFLLSVNQRKLITFEGLSVDLNGAFSSGKVDNILVVLNSGGMSCPALLHVVQFQNDSTVTLSESFGTCHEKYSAYVKKNALMIKLPAYFNPLHLKDLSDKERKQAVRKPQVIYKWSKSKLSKFSRDGIE